MANDKDKETDAERAKGTTDEPTEVVVAGITAPHVRDVRKPGASQPLVPPSGAPSAHMVKVKEVATGRVFAAWPVDARELVTHPAQEHVYAAEDEPLTPVGALGIGAGNPEPVAPQDSTSPTAVEPTARQTPPRVPSGPTLVPGMVAVSGAAGTPSGGPIDPLTATALLEEKSKSELQDLARRAGVNPDQTKRELVEALQPHVSSGTVALGGPASLAPTPPTPR